MLIITQIFFTTTLLMSVLTPTREHGLKHYNAHRIQLYHFDLIPTSHLLQIKLKSLHLNKSITVIQKIKIYQQPPRKIHNQLLGSLREHVYDVILARLRHPVLPLLINTKIVKYQWKDTITYHQFVTPAISPPCTGKSSECTKYGKNLMDP